jgi:hypothetical protein
MFPASTVYCDDFSTSTIILTQKINVAIFNIKLKQHKPKYCILYTEHKLKLLLTPYESIMRF